MSTDQVEPVVAQVARAIELAGGPAHVARLLGVSTQTVCFYRDGKRQFREKYAAELEAATAAQVTRKDIWPNSWRSIWPELAAYEAASPPTTNTSTPA